MFTQFSKMKNPFAAQMAKPTMGISGGMSINAPAFSSNMGTTNKTSFNDVVNRLLTETDQSLKAPDQLIERYLTAGDVDVHDIMIANTKADIAINVASQVATKIIQAYDRVQQIQV